MGNELIQVDYESLQKIGGHFSDSANLVLQYSSRLDDQVNILQGGEWISDAANIFYGDMHNDVMPGIDRLHKALHDAETVMQELVRLFSQADEEACECVNISDNGGAGTGAGGGFNRINPNPMPADTAPNANYTQPTIAGDVPLYQIDLMDPNFDYQEYIMNIDTDGRPVVFLLHGWSAHDEAINGGFASAQEWYAATYGDLPESDRPIIIGVAWDAEEGMGGSWSDKLAGAGLGGAATGGNPLGTLGGAFAGGTAIDYLDANENSIPAGQQFSQIVETMNYFHPDSSVNVVAHSLGNRVVMEGVINDNNIRIDNYVAVQPAVTRDWLTESGGRFNSVLTGGEVGNMSSTYTSHDVAVFSHRFVMGGMGLGNDATGIDGVQSYNMAPYDSVGWFGIPTGTNHYSYNDPIVMNEVLLQIFGEDGSGFQN